MKTIKEIRIAKGLSQEEFARYLGISYRSLQGREIGQQNYSFLEIVKAAKLNGGSIRLETEEGNVEVLVK